MTTPGTCQHLFPASPCGWNGECTEFENETAGSFCKCEAGWSQGLEFNYFLGDADDNVSAMCYHNETFLSVLYTIVAISSLTLIVGLLLFVIDTKKQLKRQVPNLLFTLLAFIAAVYRISIDSEPLFGISFVFTFFVSNSIAVKSAADTIFFNKYLSYLMKKIEFVDFTRIRSTRLRLMYISRLVMIFDIIFFELLWVTTQFEDKNTQLKLLRVIFGFGVIKDMYMIALTRTVFDTLIRDMQHIIVLNNSTLSLRTSSSNDKQAITALVESNLPKTKHAKSSIHMYNVIFLLPNFAGLFWNYFVQLWTYFLPFYFLATVLLNLPIVRMSMNRKYERKQRKNYSSTIASTNKTTIQVRSQNTLNI